MRPIDVLKGAELPFGDENDPTRRLRGATYKKTLDWHGKVQISDLDGLPYQGDLDVSTYPGSSKERGIEKAILEYAAFDDQSETPIVEVDFTGETGISQGNHRIYSLRKMKDAGIIGDIQIPMRIIYYGGRDLDPSSWYPTSKVASHLKKRLLGR